MSFICPFCNNVVASSTETIRTYESSFTHADTSNSGFHPTSNIHTHFFFCPNCRNISITMDGNGDFKNINNLSIFPSSRAKHFPSYIPKSIREDYEEAYSIVHLSPKASSTLSRRCLQGMIRDFWGISKSRLIDEINELQSVVSSSQWKAIDSLRKIGNIGAHMESDINTIVDVDPDEAEKLLKLIELLIDKWYIARHDEEELLSDISGIAINKSKQKSSNSQS